MKDNVIKDRIEEAYKAYKLNVPKYINTIDSFRKAIEDNLPTNEEKVVEVYKYDVCHSC
jgi:hypothetical protein